MRATIKYYQPGSFVTLYDFRKQSYCKGILYLTSTSVRPNYFLQTLGIFLLFIAVFSITTTLLPIIEGLLSLSNFYTNSTAKSKFIPKDPYVYSGNFILSNEFTNNEFKITIPKINLVSNVIISVDSSNESSYKEELKKGVAHANGSYLPGENGPVFLFSHSTDTVFNVEQYNAKFFALKDLVQGDEVVINFRGKQYKYLVSKKQIINPSELEVIRESNSDLILSTCFPPGTNWQRLIIFAVLLK